MSRQRRSFSAKFKSDLAIELLKCKKALNTLATENSIQPNLLCKKGSRAGHYDLLAFSYGSAPKTAIFTALTINSIIIQFLLYVQSLPIPKSDLEQTNKDQYLPMTLISPADFQFPK